MLINIYKDNDDVTISSIGDSFGNQFNFITPLRLKEREFIRIEIDTVLKKIDSVDLMQKDENGSVSRICSIEGEMHANENYIKVFYKG